MNKEELNAWNREHNAMQNENNAFVVYNKKQQTELAKDLKNQLGREIKDYLSQPQEPIILHKKKSLIVWEKIKSIIKKIFS